VHFPLVSIIIPVFNGDQYLNDTIESVQAQTYTNWELIIANDGSTDNTGNLIKANHRIMVYSRLEFWHNFLFKKETAINKISVTGHYNLFKLSWELNHQSILYYSYLGSSPFAMVNNSLFDKGLISFRLFKLIRRCFY
jgi:cellulose synthase/poly-beta-1,6-N-acetylglucosamine synthase-like glycosyltransferase